MKNLTYVLLILVVLTSCQSNSKYNSKDSIATKVGGVSNPAQSLRMQFAPIIQGYWVKSDYIDKVIRTKSPLAAADLTDGITTFYISADTLKADSANILCGYGNHDSGDQLLKFRAGKSKETIKFGAADLGYETKNGDTLLVLTNFDPDKKTTVISKFKKAPLNKYKNLGDGLDLLINKGTVSGKYTAIDSTGNKSDVTLTENGKASGFLGFTGYTVINDFNSGPMNNLDEIFFSSSKRDITTFTFKIVADTLKLYNEHPNKDSSELIVGSLKYKFIKQK